MAPPWRSAPVKKKKKGGGGGGGEKKETDPRKHVQGLHSYSKLTDPIFVLTIKK